MYVDELVRQNMQTFWSMVCVMLTAVIIAWILFHPRRWR